MKILTIPLVSAAILAAASFGAQAQQDKKMPDNAPAMNQGGQDNEKAEPGKSGDQTKDRRAQSNEKPGMQGGDQKKDRMDADTAQSERQGGDRDQMKDRDRNKSADQKGDRDRDNNKSADQKGDRDRDNNKSADQKGDRDRDTNKSADQKGDRDRDNNKSADQNQGGGKREAKQIKPEQKTVIKQTIVKENIRPAKIDVQVHVGAHVPRTVVLHPLPPTIIEIYPSYRPYKFVLLDENTILVIDPSDWTIVDVIEV